MDKFEHRRLRLQELIEVACNGRQATFAKKTEIDPTYVSRLLYPEGKKGRKRMAEDTRDQIEESFNIRRGWLDMPLGTPLDVSYDASRSRAEEPMPTWPFRSFTPQQWSALSAHDRDLAEAIIILLAGGPKKNRRPTPEQETSEA
jgi:hypothetical protein